MNLILSLLSIVLLSLISFSETQAKSCADIMEENRLLEQLFSRDYGVPENILVRWYPHWHGLRGVKSFLSHFEVDMGDKKTEGENSPQSGPDTHLWNPTLGYRPVEDPAPKDQSGYLRFSLVVEPSEYQQLQTYLQENQGKFKLQNGVGGVVKLMSKNTQIKIPFPFSKVGILTVAYFTLAHHLGYKRISEVKWVGPTRLSSLFSFQGLYEIYSSANWVKLLGGLAFSGVDGWGKIVHDLIPIFRAMGFGTNDTLPKTNASPYELKNYFAPQYTDFPMNQNPIPLAC